MSDKPNSEPAAAPAAASPATAPELPLHVAKQYGIHRETHGTPAANRAEAAASKAAVAQSADDVVSKTPAPATGEDAQTDAAIDDIMAHESDELLANAGGGAQSAGTLPKRGFWHRLGRFFAAWWRNKWARRITVIVLLLGIGAALGVPGSRYYLLNAAGVRSSVTVTVQDSSTQLPLKNVKVTVDGQQALTDGHGVARVPGVRLGAQTLDIRRIAFAPIQQHIVVGWGSNPLGTFSLQVTGVQYVLQVSDFLSGKPLAGAEADGDNGISALSDKNGKITFTTNDNSAASVPVTVSADGYRHESAVLKIGSTAKTQLVIDKKAVYVSKQGGKYDLYTADIDGQNKKLALAGTGNENNNLSLAVAPAGDWAALVSTRDNLTDSDGYRLSAITLLSLTQGTIITPEHAEQIKLIDWIGTQVIYETTVAGASAANGQRSKIIAYDYAKNSRVQLAAANQFNAALTAGGLVYYAVSGTDPNAHAGVFRIRPDGTNRQTVFSQEAWTVTRTDFAAISLQTANGWYAYNTASGVITKGDTPGSITSRLYVMSQEGSAGLWVDQRDGKGVLLAHNVGSGQDKTIAAIDGLAYPVRWLDGQTALYRVSTAQETADYAVSLNGGAPRKITDVTNTFGFAQGY